MKAKQKKMDIYECKTIIYTTHIYLINKTKKNK